MSKTKTIIFLFCLFVIGVAGRFLPHMWNTTPITALALFVSVYFGVRYSMPFVFLTMLVSDIFIGFYSWPIMLSVYGSFLLACLLGEYVRQHKNIGSLVFMTLSSSVLFFLITNWAVWQFGTMYAHSWQGFMDSYMMAIPFFKNSLTGDLFYTAFFFGAYETYRSVVFKKIVYNFSRGCAKVAGAVR